MWKILDTDVGTLGRADSKVPILGELVTLKGRSRVMEAYAGGNIIVIFGYRNLERGTI
jgi:hypothetical protein